MSHIKIASKEPDITAARERITASVSEFTRISGISRAYVYKLIQSGEIKSVSVGRLRLIILESYLEFIDRLQEGRPEDRRGEKIDRNIL